MREKLIAGRKVAGVLGLLATIVWVGCGDDGFGRRYRVSGTVTYQGEPVEQGRITFTPDDPSGRPASGEIRDGSYELTTVEPNDGALPGSYKVSISADDVDFSEVHANAGGGIGNQVDVIRANQAATPLIPTKYQRPDTSGLTAEVEEQSNQIDFDLTP